MKASLRSSRPSDQHLYVMQNEHGLIKVGRSVDPERRRLALQISCWCRLELVAILPNRGGEEEWTHMQLATHRLGHEWFAGTLEAKHAVSRLLCLGTVIIWPFDLIEALASGDDTRSRRFSVGPCSARPRHAGRANAWRRAIRTLRRPVSSKPQRHCFRGTATRASACGKLHRTPMSTLH